MNGNGSPSRPARPKDNTDRGHRRRISRARLIGVLTMTAFAAAAAVISYNDGLFLVHLAGTAGRLAYLYPLLPDGLIVISWTSMYEASLTAAARPAWATAGIALGACLTVSMNVAAGVLHNSLDALIDGVVPVVFFVALEILMGTIKRGRGGVPTPSAPAASRQDGTAEPPTTDEALRVLLATASIRGLAEVLGVPKGRVEAWSRQVKTATVTVPAEQLAEPSPNGDGSHA